MSKIILAIETSCDDTGIAILKISGGKQKPLLRSSSFAGQATFTLLANELSSQAHLHSPYGGVFPNLAKREHTKNLPILLTRAIKTAFKLPQGRTLKVPQGPTFSQFEKNPGIDAIAVTIGPGLEPALWTGIVFTKELGKKWSVPIIPVNHMEGHIFSVFKKNGKKFSTRPNGRDISVGRVPNFQFPALSLLISGGHTELVLIDKKMSYKIIGETRDDAVGEAFDKVARILGLPYPGGPHIARLAKQKRKSLQGRTLGIQKGPTFSRLSFPRPMIYSKDFDFSFSGLKTAVLYFSQKQKVLTDKIKCAISKEFQDAVTDVLVYKTNKAIIKYKIKTLIVGGGVSANKNIKKALTKMTKMQKVKIFFPEKNMAMDNAIMIGVAGYLRSFEKIKKGKLRAIGNLRLHK